MSDKPSGHHLKTKEETMRQSEDHAWFDPHHKFYVGEHVIIHDVNEDRMGGPKEGEVVKVGHKLLHVAPVGTNRAQTYRLDIHGQRPSNDDYGHGFILTLEEEAYRTLYREALATLALLGLEPTRDPDTYLFLDQLQAVIRTLTEGA